MIRPIIIKMLDDVDSLIERTGTEKNTFFSIADSAFFTKENLIKAKEKHIKFITRMSETTNLAKDFVKKSIEERHLAQTIYFEYAQGKR